MESRSAARELALLSLFQLPKNPEKLAKTDYQAIALAAVRTLTDMAKKNLKEAEAFLVQVERKVLQHKIDHPDNETKREDLSDVALPKTDELGDQIDKCYQAISLVKQASKVPELYSHYNNKQVQEFAVDLVMLYVQHKDEVDKLIDEASESWDVERIYKVDKNILRIAGAEVLHSNTPSSVVASEAVKLASKYSGPDGSKFVNGVLRDIIDSVKAH